MEGAIASQRKDREPGEVEELYLDNVQSSEICGLTEEYTNLRKLSIVNCGLTSLEGLPKLPALERLLLNDNRLTGGLDVLIDLTNLRKIELAGNKLQNLDDLKPLSKLGGLVSLDLYNCPVTSIENYRDQVFELLTSLNSLDGLDKTGEEVEDSEGDEEEDEAVNKEEDEEEESDSDDEPGLDYLTRELGSDDSEGEEEYDPDADEALPDDDFVPSDEERDDNDAGPSKPKKPRLDPEPEQEPDQDNLDSD